MLAGHALSWIWIGPFLGLIVTLTALTFAYRLLAERAYPAGEKSDMVAVVSWWVLAAGCMLGGATGGFLAANPDGSMQPGPRGAPWEMVALGTAAGAALGAIAVGLIRVVAKLERR